MIGNCSVFKFLRHSVDGKHLMCFQSETAVFNFFGVVSTGSQSAVLSGVYFWDLALYLLCWRLSVDLQLGIYSVRLLLSELPLVQYVTPAFSSK